jgi:class 3 adenylate cyclase
VATRTLAFLFADIEGSTAMLRRLGGAYPGMLADHHRPFRVALTAHGGGETDAEGRAGQIFQLQAEGLRAASGRCGHWTARC